MSDALKLFLATLVSAAAAGIQKIIAGGSQEDALDASIEALATERARIKFPDLEVGRDG